MFCLNVKFNSSSKLTCHFPIIYVRKMIEINNTTVGLNGKPMPGHSPLSPKQAKVVSNNWDDVVKLIRKVWPK